MQSIPSSTWSPSCFPCHHPTRSLYSVQSMRKTSLNLMLCCSRSSLSDLKCSRAPREGGLCVDILLLILISYPCPLRLLVGIILITIIFSGRRGHVLSCHVCLALCAVNAVQTSPSPSPGTRKLFLPECKHPAPSTHAGTQNSEFRIQNVGL